MTATTSELIPVAGTAVSAVAVTYRRQGRKLNSRGRIVGVYPNGSVRMQPLRPNWRQVVISPAELNAGKGITLTDSPGADSAGEALVEVEESAKPAAPTPSLIHWVNAAHELPDADETVLIADEANEVSLGFHAGDDGWRYACAAKVETRITHWAALPHPPQHL